MGFQGKAALSRNDHRTGTGVGSSGFSCEECVSYRSNQSDVGPFQHVRGHFIAGYNDGCKRIPRPTHVAQSPVCWSTNSRFLNSTAGAEAWFQLCYHSN